MITSLTAQRSIPVSDERDASPASIASQAMAYGIGMSADQIERVGSLAVHAAMGILRRSGAGILLISETYSENGAGIEFIALDGSERNGSTIAASSNIEAMCSIADQFEAYLPPGKSGAIMARVWSGGVPSESPRFGAAWAPYPGQHENGDLWALEIDTDSLTLMVSDGLGHGPIAASASQEAMRAFAESPRSSPSEHVARCHDSLRQTYGAVIAVAKISWALRSIQFAGVGNISAMVMDDKGTRHLISHNGVVGHSVRKIQEFRVGLPVGSLLIMHTDGLKTRWDFESYPELFHASPAIICAILLRDFRRAGDDACVVALRC